MALPTVHFHSAAAGTNSSLLSVWMTQLDNMLVNDAGWERSFVDSDAIGGGSAGAPAWDKTPVINTDAGVAVYRMPLNDHDTRWYVRLRPGWSAATSRPYMRGVTIGDTHDGTGGVTGAGSEVTGTTATSQTDNRQVMLAVSEDGFALHLPNNNTTNVISTVERARRSDTGEVTDDAFVITGHSGLDTALVRSGVGLVSNPQLITFARWGLAGSAPSPFNASLANHDGSHIPIVGPFITGGHPFLHGRLMFLVNVQDHSVNSDRDIEIDGGSKTYRVAGGIQSNNWAVIAVATE